MNDSRTPESNKLQAESKSISQEQLQHEVDYIRAQHMLQSLFHKGLLSSDEFAKITAVNRKTFSPVLAAILPSIP
ncbi:SHOCT domain-containing protein [Megasphaera cerevisiae]|uniref:SHOCT domain-containing protein n=1 Tax=Megasphaera cerevisiae TaxID=39029 RepID=UPI000945A49A|nr:SHOCT domain-containing protein [Megasphaera cerevisiae]OKY53205.1 hypothetical protein BSR42_08635 [Megasphaera cerevisiae]